MSLDDGYRLGESGAMHAAGLQCKAIDEATGKQCTRERTAKGYCRAHHRRRRRVKTGEISHSDLNAPIREPLGELRQVLVRVPTPVYDALVAEGPSAYAAARGVLTRWYSRQKHAA